MAMAGANERRIIRRGSGCRADSLPVTAFRKRRQRGIGSPRTCRRVLQLLVKARQQIDAEIAECTARARNVTRARGAWRHHCSRGGLAFGWLMKRDCALQSAPRPGGAGFPDSLRSLGMTETLPSRALAVQPPRNSASISSHIGALTHSRTRARYRHVHPLDEPLELRDVVAQELLRRLDGDLAVVIDQ